MVIKVSKVTPLRTFLSVCVIEVSTKYRLIYQEKWEEQYATENTIFVKFRRNIRGIMSKENVLGNFDIWRVKISIDLFDEIVCNPTHNLHSLLPQRKSCKYALRRKSDFTLPLCKTERLKNSFIFSHVYKMQKIFLILSFVIISICKYPVIQPMAAMVVNKVSLFRNIYPVASIYATRLAHFQLFQLQMPVSRQPFRISKKPIALLLTDAL